MGLFKRREADEPLLVERAEAAPPIAGAPGTCPKCGGSGYLDHIDLVARIQRQHCRACGHEWQISLADEPQPSFFDLDDGSIELPPGTTRR